MGFLSFLGTPLGWVMWAIYQVVQNYGWALVLFIVLTRAAMYPLGIKQQKSMSRTMAIQPKLKQLQKQYAKDKQRCQEETMKLYEKEGVSPTAGCLPSLIPMVLLFGIIDVVYYPLKHILHISADVLDQAMKVYQSVGGAGASSWQLTIINQINSPSYDGVYDKVFGHDIINQIHNFNLNFLGLNLGQVPSQVWGVLILVPILAFLAQIGTTLLTLHQQKKNGQQQMQGVMKWVMLLMPLLSLWWGFTMPAGVGLYWFLSSGLMMAQQLLLQKRYPPEKLAAINDKNSEKNREKMRRKREKLEAMNQKMAERGLSSTGKPLLPEAPAKELPPSEKIDVAKEKELAKNKLAEARRRMAEKYGDTYSVEADEEPEGTRRRGKRPPSGPDLSGK